MVNSGSHSPESSVTFGSRKSKLALWQTHKVCEALCANEPALLWRLETMHTAGDKNLAQPLPEIGGKGLFTEELNRAIRQSEIDVAIHSLKDLPTIDDPGIKTTPVLEREDPRDVLIARDGLKLSQLPKGAIVGTSSPRRKAQLLAMRPDLVVKAIRGNVPTRVAKVLEPDSHPQIRFDAIVMAAAGIIRLDLQDTITEYFPLDEFLPAPGQGCVAATCRTNDTVTQRRLSAIAKHETTLSVTAERQLLHFLGGGCSAPIAAYGRFINGQLTLTGRVAALDGQTMVTQTQVGDDPVALANALASELLSAGADTILAEAFPLRGKRVVITRAVEQINELAGQIQAKGGAAVRIPLIQFAATMSPDQARTKFSELENCDRIVFTSANGVRYFNQLIPAEQSIQWRDKMFFVGPKTAETMQQTWSGNTPFPNQKEFGDTYSAKDYALSLDIRPGEKIIVPTAVVHMKEIVSMLQKKDADVSIWSIYETTNTAIDRFTLAELNQGFDAILFVSPSAVRSFCEQIDNYIDVLKNVVIGCVGTTTAQRAEDRGLQVQVVPERFTTEDLVDALAGYFENRKGQS